MNCSPPVCVFNTRAGGARIGEGVAIAEILRGLAAIGFPVRLRIATGSSLGGGAGECTVVAVWRGDIGVIIGVCSKCHLM